MEPAAHLDHFRADAARVGAAARLGTTAPVLGCPGWDVAQLLEHLGRVHRWVVRSFDAPTTERVEFIAADDPEPGDDLPGWYDARAAELADRFDTIEPDKVVATFVGPQPVTWWMRRQAQETSVHRWDAQRAHGTPDPIDPPFASDGVDEYVTTFLSRWKGKLAHVGGTVHLHCTDTDGEWFMSFDDGTPTVERVHAKGDVAARGPAADLLLMIWGRVPHSELDVIGDAAVLDRLLTTINVV